MPDTEKPVLSYIVKAGLLFTGWFVIFMVVSTLQHGGVLSTKVAGGMTTGLFGVLFFGWLALSVSEVRRRERGGQPTPRQQRRKSEKRPQKLPAASSGTPGWSQRGAGLMPDTGYRGTPFVVRVFALAGIWFIAMFGLNTALVHHIVTRVEAGGILLASLLAVLFALIIWSALVSDHRQKDGVGTRAGRAKAYFSPTKEAMTVYHPQVITPAYPVAASVACPPSGTPFASPPVMAPAQIAPPAVVVAPLAPLRDAAVIAPAATVDMADPERVNNLLCTIESMPGMGHVSTQIRNDVHRLAADTVRKLNDEPVLDRELHTLFIGPPGTGKTTIARRYAEIFCALQVLPTDTFVEVTRGDLVGEYVGHTAQKVRAAVERATGGLLFIDEAYGLAPRGENDFAYEANAELLKLMEDDRITFAVIAAGYEHEMAAWLASNTGLASRFSHRITFDAYDGGTLFQIAETMLDAVRLSLDADARGRLATHLARAATVPGTAFANGRAVRQLVDDLYGAQAVRLAASGLTGDAAARRVLTADDVAAVVGERTSGRR